jgi:predicted Zn-dependent protease with MMP-like domain
MPLRSRIGETASTRRAGEPPASGQRGNLRMRAGAVARTLFNDALACGASQWIAVKPPPMLCRMTETTLPDPLTWRPLKAPSLTEFEAIAIEAFRRLPAHFRAKCEGMVIQVDDYPTEEVLDAMKIESELDLMGLFQGVGLPFQSESAPVQMPNMVWLYRVPILLYWVEHEETLGAVITHVLVHEIGHHFGLSDDDMMEIERAAD